MASLGQLSPIRVRPLLGSKPAYEIIFGHRRTVAAKRLGWKTIRAEVIPASNDEMVVLALAENLNRTDFTDYEKGKLFHELNEVHGWSYQKIAAVLGKSISYVAQHIAMLELFDVTSLGEETEAGRILGQLSERHARALMRLPKIKDRLEISRLVILANLSVRETERLIARLLATGQKGSRKRMNEIRSERLNSLVERIVSAYSRKALSELAAFRHPIHFSLFDDLPPYERLNYKKTLLHTSQLMQDMTNVKIMVDGVEVKAFHSFGLVSFYIRFDSILQDRPYRMLSRASLVFMYSEGDWKIIHEHWSTMSPYCLESLSSKITDVDNLALSPNFTLQTSKVKARNEERPAEITPG
jgi:ParB family transcriptional regulator, chromosome partitioning protein